MAWTDDLPLLLIVLALSTFVVIGVMRLRQRFRLRGPARVVRPVPVPPEDIELIEGPVSACMRCGSTRVRIAKLSEGGIPGSGEMLTSICGRCGHRGPAIEFPDTTAYRQFIKGLHGGNGEN